MRDYIKNKPTLNQAAFARSIGMRPQKFNDWLHGRKNVNGENWEKIRAGLEREYGEHFTSYMKTADACFPIGYKPKVK